MLFIAINQDINNINKLIFTSAVMIAETCNFTVVRLFYFQIIITKSSHVQNFWQKKLTSIKKWITLSSNIFLVILFFVLYSRFPFFEKFFAVCYLEFSHNNLFQSFNYKSKAAIFLKNKSTCHHCPTCFYSILLL